MRTLEERMLQLQGLASQELVPAGGRLASREFGEGTVMARVDTLEQAVATLTRVQVCPHRFPPGIMKSVWELARIHERKMLAYGSCHSHSE